MKIVESTAIVVGAITAAGTGIIVDNIIKATTPANIGKLSKVAVWFGKLFIGGLASAVVGAYATKEVTTVGTVLEAGIVTIKTMVNNHAEAEKAQSV
jgi:hypothetical protein